ncbi:hypothetical protein BPOR_0652g00010 [Botrytis porri]|uniref:Major facilitator superfamily (MFS) profile domain-containing protein n=1 Tax=Botrytis porri TaxID=87229 RepID=A0A4Z1KCP0_9HELO|nr:hypothetical protein BPOR_0652g00010 [Botrytis porri]
MTGNEKSTEPLATSELIEASLPIGIDSIPNLLHRLNDLGLRMSDDNIIDWLPKNQNHPRNWPLKRKLANTACIFLLDTFGALLESGGLIAATQAATEYGISQTQSLIAFSLMYGIGGALGSIVFPPYSEAFGRKPILTFAALLLPLSCMITGLVPSIAGVYIGRFIMGATISIPSTINVGSLEDMWEPATQGHAIYAWVLSAGLGAALGRWLYHIGSIVSVCIFVVILLGISETRPSKLLGNHLIAIQSCAGTLKIRTQTADDHVPDFHTFCQSAIIQPAKLFFQEPIILTMATLSAIAFSLLFLFTESLDIVFKPYGFSPTSYSLAFIAYAMLVEFFHLKKRAETKELEPEDKIIGFATGASALAAGLWLMAWTTPPLVHGIDWVVPMIGLAGAGFAANEIEYALGNYLADTYTVYASSAFAAYSTLRALLSGIFPLFADQMYNGLGSNVAGSILAGVATLWLISPFVFIKYGKALREKGKFAKFSLENGPNTRAVDVLGRQVC